MQNPFSFIAERARGRIFWPLVLSTVLAMAVMNISGAPLTTAAAPAGIVSYELAGSVTHAGQVLASWDEAALQRAAFVQGFDFLFIPLYVSAIALGCALASSVLARRGWALAWLGSVLGWGLILAGLLDIVENIALLVMLFNAPADPWPAIAYWCAIPKFGLIVMGLLYALFGGLLSLFSRSAS